MSDYDHKKIESKWQKKWEESGVNKTPEKVGDKKCYVLDMFPYPSGAGLHVGHPKGYIATDIYSRYKRMAGFDVLHPMGWDAFGLPAENFAIKTNIHPKETTEEAIANYKRQIGSLALSYDWTREIDTHTPEYYKWTQWIFLELFKKGLAYKKVAPVNWDPVDQTVLANEQVLADGTAERSGAKVIKKDLEQWFFKITDYADELIDGLDNVDWPESTVKNQRNWIGRSEGLLFKSPVKDMDLEIETYNTHFEAFFADTFVVIAPDHPLLETLLDGLDGKEEVLSFSKKIIEKRLEGKYEDKEPEGIFTGRYIEDPIGNGDLPIWVSSYALAEYGTGIVKASAHDERDFKFAKKYDIKLKPVLFPKNEEEALKVKNLEVCYTDMVKGVLSEPAEFKGQVAGEIREEIADYAEEKGFAKKKVFYKLRDWLVSRQRYWGAPIPVVYDPEGKAHPVPEEHLPWLLPTDVEFRPKGTSPLGSSKELLERTEKIFGKGWKPEIDTMDTFVCSSWYYLRFANPKNNKKFASEEDIKKWLPVDIYVGGAEHTVLHLMYARFFTKALRDMGYLDFDEPFLKLRHQGLIMASDGRKMSKSFGNVINPDEVVSQHGADTMRLYEMFMGPFNQSIAWSTDNIVGVRRFIEKIWRLKDKVVDVSEDDELTSLIHGTIKKVEEDIQNFRFNTSVSALMILVNKMDSKEKIKVSDFEIMLKIIYPLAPHIAEELWSGFGNKTFLSEEKWPEYDKEKIKSSSFEIAVQVNGKVRGSFEIEEEISEEIAKEKALSLESVKKWTDGKDVKKIIYIKNKLVNLVV